MSGLIVKAAGVLAVALLAGCATTEPRAPFQVAPKPSQPPTGAARSLPVRGANADLAVDFADLYFLTEWDEARARLAKWVTPPRVEIADPALRAYEPFLSVYLGRLRRGAGVDIALVEPGAGDMLVKFAPGEQMRRAFNSAFCIVAPGRLNWAQMLDWRLDPDQFNWTRIAGIDSATAFIPHDAAPYQIRACLMEEVAQALGPGNDIFRLADSAFNDDGAHAVPTSFDLLALRVLYDPSLEPGMTRKQAEPLIAAALARFRPQDGD